MRRIVLIACMILAGCGALPRDPNGTLDHVTQSKQLRVGLVASGSAAGDTSAAALIAEVERQTGAFADIRPGAAEPLLADLDTGRLDLVIGPFAQDSPWATGVAFAPPLVRWGPKDAPIELKAAMANGENRWIMLVERASRAVSPVARE